MNKLGDPGLGPIAAAAGDLSSSSLSRLCSYVLSETLQQIACRIDPQRYLQASRFLQISSISGAPVEISGDTLTLNVSAFVGYTENQTVSTTKQLNFWTGLTGGVTGSAGINVFGTGANASLGWKAEAGWSIMHSWEKAKMDTQQVSVVEMKSLNAEALSFQFPAKVHRCVAVKPTDGKSAGHYFCDTNLKAQSLSESWYYISQPRSVSTVLQDSGNLADNGWMKIIRGQEQFSGFRKLIDDSSKALVLEKDESFLNAAKTFGKSFGGLSGVVPLLDDSNIPGVVLTSQ